MAAAAAAEAAAGLSGGQMACAMLFGTMILTYLGLEASRLRVLLRDGVDPATRLSASKHSEPLSMSFPSLYAFCRDSAALGLILLLAFMCEKYPLYPQGGKEWDRDMYWFLCLLLLVASVMTMRKGKSTDILNRDQTEEWKGWMQFMFLLYHYYHAEEVYNAIRIMITCYVWMTGFGNFSFFYIKQDFGFVRFVQMLWRLNFLVVLLCLSQGNTYILYYICPLHTFYFLLVYATMRIAPKANHGKWDVRLKLMTVAVVIYLVWDCFGGRVFSLLFGTVLSSDPVIGAKSGSLWEWYFRTSLDHWSTLLGMVFALNFPLATRWLTAVEAQPAGHQAVVKGITGLAIGGPFLWWAATVFPQPKLAYNLTNSYYGFIPLLAYIYFRNLTPSLRVWHSGLLHDIGKVTLETYLMQHHVWLTGNAKTLLVLLPGYPKCNLVVTSVLFVYVSRRIYALTMSLRGMVLPDDRRRCVAGATATVAVLTALYGLGWLLAAVGLGFATAAILASAAAAVALAVIHRHLNLNLWGQVRTGPSGSGGLTALRAPSSPEAASSLGRIAFFVVFGGFLLSLPLRAPLQPATAPAAPAAAAAAAAPATPAVAAGGGSNRHHNLSVVSTPPSTCLHLVNDGQWACPAGATCATPADETWSWTTDGAAAAAAASAAGCGFHAYDPEELKALYAGKEVVVVGDSVGRKYYYGLLAALGSPSPQAHDHDAAKHQDLHFEAEGEGENGGLRVSFLWRPYAKEVQDQVAKWSTGVSAPDVLVLSFGLWDTLHQTPAADLAAAVEGVAASLQQQEEKEAAGEAAFMAWLLPTTVVDAKLLTDEKKQHMTEAHVAATRAAALGGALPGAVDVVLDGAKVTQGLAARSEDGVHYDDGVYAAVVQIAANAYATAMQGGVAADKTAAAGDGSGGRSRSRRRLVVGLDDVADWEEWATETEEGGTGVGGGWHRVLKAAGGGGGGGPKPKEIDGSMSSPAYGAFVLVVVALMLLTMDSYAGASYLSLLLTRSEASVTWEEAYEPLLSKILRSAPAAVASQHAPSGSIGGGGGGGGGSGHAHSHSGVGGAGAAARGRYTPVPQGEIELGGVDQPISPPETGTNDE